MKFACSFRLCLNTFVTSYFSISGSEVEIETFENVMRSSFKGVNRNDVLVYTKGSKTASVIKKVYKYDGKVKDV